MIGRTNAGAGGAAGGTLTVTAPAGVTVTVSKDGKTKTRVADSSGVVTFKGLKTGTWTVTISDGEQTATRKVAVTADYTVVIAFFSATINITYPAGSTCTATDGTTTLTAPDTTGTWACVVPNAGTWTVSCTDGTESTSEAVAITTDGQSVSAVLSYFLWLYKDGDTCDTVSGGWSPSEYKITGGSFDAVATFGQNDMTIANNAGNGSVYCGNVFTNNSNDLSGISSLKFKITGIGKTTYYSSADEKTHNIQFSLVVASARPDGASPTFTADLRILATGEYSIDVSSISAGYVGIWIKSGGYAKTTLTISEIWGEK